MHMQVDWMLSTDLFTDFWMLADILMNFRTGVIIEQVCLRPSSCQTAHSRSALLGWDRSCFTAFSTF